ncbi:MAG TPA: ATP-binding cassette domain-containing protein [Streptosporangiaceae bacterium]|nr:ATP-binding cassette domain-containing protein [Streptosporangiaceae bacterium]
MTTTAIAASGLRKAYRDKTVLDGIDLEVPAGTVFSLLGPNGAGKTTTVNILTTLIRPDGGTAQVAGHDITAAAAGVRSAIGVTGQFAAVDELLTGRENLRLIADLKRVRSAGPIIGELLERFDLTGSADTLVSAYSGGMRRKLDLAMTLVGSPRVIFLDEPTTGLDPRSRRTLWDIVRGLAAAGTTIFLTTQYLEEADQLASQIAVLDQGRIVARGTPAELKRQVPGSHIRLQFTTSADLDAAARVLPAAARNDQDLTLEVPGDGTVQSLRALLARLDEYSLNPQDLSVHTPDLDDVFLALTGHPNTEEIAR